jgi:hypothetical protein
MGAGLRWSPERRAAAAGLQPERAEGGAAGEGRVPCVTRGEEGSVESEPLARDGCRSRLENGTMF